MVAIVGAAPGFRPDLRILLVKTSSLGDVVHNLPVVTDLRRHFPAARIDWLIEEGFAEIPSLHPGVSTSIPVAVRRWRKSLFKPDTWAEIFALRHALHNARYDLVIDTQGLLKSALLARWTKAETHGYDATSIREPLAARLYAKQHAVSRELHAVERNRRLVAASCGYTLSDEASALDYGLSIPTAPLPYTPANPYVVLLTATSRDDKLWPEEAWISLGRALAVQGLQTVLPSGSMAERERAKRIAAAIGGHALPPLGIPALARLLGEAEGVIGVDTGLTHLGAALGRPTIAIFCASEPGLTGVFANQSVANLGAAGMPPSPELVLSHCRNWGATA